MNMNKPQIVRASAREILDSRGNPTVEVDVFLENGIEFDIVAGSSVGSIFATLLACGYKSYELENLFMKVNFELFRDIHLGFGKGMALSKGGIFSISFSLLLFLL